MLVMRLSMLLQRHLEDEVHDVSVLDDDRRMARRAGRRLSDARRRPRVELLVGSEGGLQAEGVQFDQEIEKLLKLLRGRRGSRGQAGAEAAP